MSIYDTLLGTIGQGYAQANQNAMAQAQMPTFADRFLAGLRQNTEDEYKRRMGEGSLAMNQAYKLSQEQHMREQERLGMLQRQSAALAPTRNVTPLTYDSAVAQVTGLGGQASWVPRQKFETNYENVAMPIDQQQQELAAGAGLGIMQDQTFNPSEQAEYQTPIDGSGWGQESWQKELERRNKMSVQELKGEQAAQVKRDKESQIAKLNRELQQKLITPQQHALGIIKAVAIADSRAAGLAGQGIIVNPLLNVPGAQGGLGAGSVPPTLPSMGQGGTPAPAMGKTVGGNGLPAPDPNSVKGRENAVAIADVTKVADGALGNINSMRREINGIAGDQDKSFGLSAEGLVTRKLPLSKSYAFNQRVESLKARLMMNAMAMLKSMSATGATGLGALSDKEGEILRMSIASLDANQGEFGFNRSLQTILDTFDRMERETLSHKNNLLRARGTNVPQSPSSQPTSSVDSSNPLLQ